MTRLRPSIYANEAEEVADLYRRHGPDVTIVESDAWLLMFRCFAEHGEVPEVIARTHLHHHAQRVRRGEAAWPSLRVLADELRWSRDRVHRLVRSLPDLVDVVRTAPPEVDVREAAEGELFELPTSPQTHADLVATAVRWLRGPRKCAVAFAEIVTYARVNPDAIGFTGSGGSRPWSILVEVKVSRSDFRADRHKAIHRHPDSCPGQERWYLTPPGLVRADELPDGWGLAEAGKSRVRVVREAARPPFNGDRAAEDTRILLSALRRHECGARWNAAAGRFETVDANKARMGGGA